MKFVIEFEGYQLKRRFVFKELVIYDLTSSTINHFFIKPPCPRELLTSSEEKTVRYCEAFLHKIKWHSGNTHLKDVIQFLNNLPEASIIYTKGRNKTNLLASMFKKFTVLNLEEENCPPITKIFVKPETECPLGFHKDSLNCAHLKANAFATYIRDHEQASDQELKLS